MEGAGIVDKVQEFLKELDEISRKHGVWLNLDDVEGSLDLEDAECKVVAEGLSIDPDSQEYKVATLRGRG